MKKVQNLHAHLGTCRWINKAHFHISAEFHKMKLIMIVHCTTVSQHPYKSLVDSSWRCQTNDIWIMIRVKSIKHPLSVTSREACFIGNNESLSVRDNMTWCVWQSQLYVMRPKTFIQRLFSVGQAFQH